MIKQGRIKKAPFLAAAKSPGLRPPRSPSSTGLLARLRGLPCASSPADFSLADNWLFLNASLFRTLLMVISLAGGLAFADLQTHRARPFESPNLHVDSIYPGRAVETPQESSLDKLIEFIEQLNSSVGERKKESEELPGEISESPVF